MWVAGAFEVGFYAHSSFANGEALAGTPGRRRPIEATRFLWDQLIKGWSGGPGRGAARLAASQPWVEGTVPFGGWGYQGGGAEVKGVWMVEERRRGGDGRD